MKGELEPVLEAYGENAMPTIVRLAASIAVSLRRIGDCLERIERLAQDNDTPKEEPHAPS